MTDTKTSPHEKAEEILNRMFMLVQKDYQEDEYFKAKQCALAAVDEIILDCPTETYQYWKKVKCEIENL